MKSSTDSALNRLAAELFRTFARFEYALKAAGYHNGEGDAEPNWRKFALTVAPAIENPQSEELKQAITYLLEHPPKKQVIKDGVLIWKILVPNTDSKADLILLYVRRVRNNLLHGGKFNGRWFEPQRSEELLRHSLTILRACLDAASDVNEAYHHR